MNKMFASHIIVALDECYFVCLHNLYPCNIYQMLLPLHSPGVHSHAMLAAQFISAAIAAQSVRNQYL